MPWNPGDQIVLYEMWGPGIASARPVTVVEDVPTHLAFYSHPGVTIATRGIPNRRSLSLSERIDVMIRAVDPNVGEFREVVTPSLSHVLTITPPDSGHAVWLFWSSDWEFKSWYVNLQSPLRRVPQGVQLHDYVLDFVVSRDMTWTWKDMDELEALTAQGFLSAEQEESIRDEAAQVVQTIESGGRPFCDGWPDWRPNSSWPAPRLPADWPKVDGTEAPVLFHRASPHLVGFTSAYPAGHPEVISRYGGARLLRNHR